MKTTFVQRYLAQCSSGSSSVLASETIAGLASSPANTLTQLVVCSLKNSVGLASLISRLLKNSILHIVWQLVQWVPGPEVWHGSCHYLVRIIWVEHHSLVSSSVSYHEFKPVFVSPTCRQCTLRGEQTCELEAHGRDRQTDRQTDTCTQRLYHNPPMYAQRWLSYFTITSRKAPASWTAIITNIRFC